MAGTLQHPWPARRNSHWGTHAGGTGGIAGCRWRPAPSDRPRPPRTRDWRGRDAAEMILLLDIGNTHTHLGVANRGKVGRTSEVPTKDWFAGRAASDLQKFLGARKLEGAALCSVVPDATPLAVLAVQQICSVGPRELTSKTVRGIGIK